MSKSRRPVDARTAAALAIADAIGGRRFAQDALRELRDDERLSGRDAALAAEITLGAVRHVVTLEHILACVASYHAHRTPVRIRAILLAAAFQMIWMDRVPIHAAVSEAVERARALAGGRAPGMVNAVLRRLSDAIEARGVEWRRLEPNLVRTSWAHGTRFRGAVLPDPIADGEPAYLAAAAGETAVRYTKLVERFGALDAEHVAWASQAIPAIVVLRNPLRIDSEAFRIAIEAAARHAPDVGEDAAFLAASESVMDWPAFRAGQIYVQDLTAHAAAAAVDARPGQRVLDLCAAPGGKSLALALAMRDEGAVVACDTNAQRLTRVLANVSRLELNCVQTRLLSAASDDPLADEPPFDAALVDVPCSNTGVIARRPEARLGLTSRKLKSLTEIQVRLLRLAAAHVRPGGRLIYSTCSIEPDENEAITRTFLDETAGWSLEFEHTTLPSCGPHLRDWRDGGHVTRLVRA